VVLGRRWQCSYKYKGQYTVPVKKKFWTKRGAKKFMWNTPYLEYAMISKVK
jgi:hypothetical protein